MIAWSNAQLKLTAGIGALGVTALLADISHNQRPAWLAIAIALLPIVIFLFVRPDEMPRSVVLPLQVFAAIWYLALAAILTVLFFQLPQRPQGWPVYFVCLGIGCIPCVVISWWLMLPQAGQQK